MATTQLDGDLETKLLNDSGWWRVDWRDGRVTYFRQHDKALAIATHFNFVLPSWVQELPIY